MKLIEKYYFIQTETLCTTLGVVIQTQQAWNVGQRLNTTNINKADSRSETISMQY